MDTSDHPDPRDRLQIAAFHSFFTWGLRRGLSRLQAFAEAIVKSSDEAYKKADTRLVDEYMETYQ